MDFILILNNHKYKKHVSQDTITDFETVILNSHVKSYLPNFFEIVIGKFVSRFYIEKNKKFPFYFFKSKKKLKFCIFMGDG